MTTSSTAQEAAGRAAEAIRALNHQTRPGAAHIDVTDVYDLLAEVGLMAGRLPQLLRQLEQVLDDLVEHGELTIVDGPTVGDPVAAAAICGHWLVAASGAAAELSRWVEAAQQALTWASAKRP